MTNSSFRYSIYSSLRYDILPILLYILVLFFMTYPLMLELDQVIPLRNMDTYTAIWQNWWINESLMTGQDSALVDILFYPAGLNTEIQPRRWATFPLWLVLSRLFGEPTTYNLTVLVQSLIRAYGMYRLILLFIPHRPSAWIGGAIFAYSPHALAYGIQQPQVGSVEFLPFFMIAWVVLIRHFMARPEDIKRGLILTVIASFAFALNMFQGPTIGIYAMLLGGLYALWSIIVHRLWRDVKMWGMLILFGVLAVIISSPVILPILTSDNFDSAVSQYTPSVGLDVLLYLQMDLKSPIYYNQWIANLNGTYIAPAPSAGFSKLSLLSLVAAVMGSVYILRKEKRNLIWLIITLLFFVLSWGTMISFNGEIISEWAPYQLLLNNPIFVIIREPARLQILMLFGFAMLTAFGIYWISQRIVNRRLQMLVMVVCAFVMLFETSISPLPSRSSEISPAYHYLMESGEEGAIIDIPMHRQSSKVYMYGQIFHQRPIVEGMTGRMPPDAYDYIQSNPFLDTIYRRGQELDADLIANWDTVIQDLIDTGFRYVVVHHDENDGIYRIWTPDEFVDMLLPDVTPVFESDRASVYDLYDVKEAF